MSRKRGRNCLLENAKMFNFSQKRRIRSVSCESLNSYHSKGDVPDFSGDVPCSNTRKRSSLSSCESVKSNWSKDLPTNFREETPSQGKRFKHEPLHHSGFQNHRSVKNFPDSLFLDLENRIIVFLRAELTRFKKILQKKDFAKDFNENSSMKEAALDLTLHFLREMKQDEAADTLQDELFFVRQLKCSLKNKYQCVFEGITKQGDSTLLNSIYTDLYITQGGSEQINTEHEVRQIESFSRRSKSLDIPVECKNLFKASEQDGQIRSVLTKGVAGIGKSISVQKFVLDWAEEKDNQDIRFIFPLPFREMNLKGKEEQSLMDLLTQFFPETKDVSLSRRQPFKVLFILDGLDECRLPLNFKDNEMCRDVSSPVSLDVLLTNLITGNLLPSALVWITTRPAAASKIPPQCIDRVTEVRGFNDGQKEEYFRKRFTDQNQAKEIIDHVKQSKSLFIMCHIPVFCWISATVLHNILQEKRNHELKNNYSDDASETITPKTLTQMYTHFLRFQIQQSRRKYEGEYTPNVSWDKNTIISLGKLAFVQLERNNLIFYDTDLEDCGIDVSKASVYSSMCTQIFKEETGIFLGTMYCFVHLSIQEFVAALYAHLFLDIHKKIVFFQDSTEKESKDKSVIDLLKTAVDKALESDTGHLDLFLRFLLGLSLQSNRRLLRVLLTQEDINDQSKKEIVQYIKQKLEADLSPERSINLFYCLNELNDQTLVKEIQTHLREGSLSSADLSPAQWSAVAFVLLTSEEEMEEFELQKFKKSDECLIRLTRVIKNSKRALLNDCGLTHRSCSALATTLKSENNLIELNMNNNNLHNSGVKLLCTGLKNVNCKLKILRLAHCSITEEGYKALSSALRSNSHLIELDLTGNDPGPSGVKKLKDLLKEPDCKLKTMRFLSAAAEKAFQFVSGFVGQNPLLLRELNLSKRELGDTGVNQLAALLQEKHCKLNTIHLCDCSITESQCLILASALKSNPSHLRELDLSWNQIKDTGVNHLHGILDDSHCKLERLRLRDCYITDEGCSAVTLALRSNQSHLRELDLSWNELGVSGVKNLSDLLGKPQCKLETLHLCGCSITEDHCLILTSALKSNPSHLRELNLSSNKLGESGVKNLGDLLIKRRCTLKKLNLCDCSITEKQCLILTSALKSNPSHLRELNLSENPIKNTGVNHLCELLKDSHCKLERLRLRYCALTDEGCSAVTSAGKSNPSHLRELDLSGNQLKNTGVNHFCELLKDSHCKLERLRLRYFDMTDEGFSAVMSALKSNPSHLRELDLSGNKLTDAAVENLSDLLMNIRCKLEKLHLYKCTTTEEQCLMLISALKSNPSHLIELDLSWNELKDTGVNHLCDVLNDSHCKLERLSLFCCGITDVSLLTQTLMSKNVLHFLKELDLRFNNIGESMHQLMDVIRDSNCALR